LQRKNLDPGGHVVREKTLSLLCSPVRHEPLKLIKKNGQEFLVSEKSLEKFIIRDSIPVFIRQEEIVGLNKKYQKMYDRIALGYDFFEKIGAFFLRKSQKEIRCEFIKELEIRENYRVLEISIGTGINLKYLPEASNYFGIDISWGMLKKCIKNMKHWGLGAELFLCEAEALPFKDGVFDVVWHMGGINFFNDKAQAIKEMIRVAKSGTKIVIVDETEKHSKSVYERIPFVKRFYRNRNKIISAPVEFVPEEMLDVQVKEIWNGRLYCLTFRIP